MRLPSEQYQYLIRECLEPLLYMCGLAVTQHNCKWSVRTSLYVVMIVWSITSAINTMLNHSKTLALSAASIIGFILQAVLKYVTYLVNAKAIAHRIDYLHRIYVQCERNADDAFTIPLPAVPATKESHVLGMWQKYFLLMTKLFAVIVTLTTSTIFVCSVFANVVLHVPGFPLPVIPPLIDVETTQGAAIVWCSHVIMLLGSTFGIVAADTLMVVLLLHVCPMSQILCIKLTAMGDRLSRSRSTQCDGRASRFLVNCIRLHQEFIQYLHEMSHMYYIIFGFELLSNFVSMCMVLFALMMVDWMPLYGILLVFFWKTFILCAIGTIMETQTDNINKSFSSFPYYVLGIADQRRLRFCIQISQHPGALIAGTVPINMALFVQIMKNVYTFTMVLYTMFD